jgi:hypothetical protein
VLAILLTGLPTVAPGCGDDGGDLGDTDTDVDTDTDTDTDIDTDTDADTDTCDLGAWEGDFIVVNADSIDYELEGYTEVTGELLVDDTWLWDLDGLQCLQAVGALRIVDNSDLYCLYGLDNLEQVDGRMLVVGNTGLEQLSGLGSLTTVGGELELGWNPQLVDLWGLDSLTSAGSLMVLGNEELESLEALESLTAVEEDLLVMSNELLPYCEICDLLEQLDAEPTTVTATDSQDDSCWTDAGLSCPF